MKRTRVVAPRHPWLTLIFVLAAAMGAAAQGDTSAPSSDTGDGKEVGGYQVHQSVEFGYRFSDITGSSQVFDTFLNQHTGPRLLEQTFSMQSVNGAGVLFDDLNVSSFGWGGDPENVGRVRVSKFKWYDLNFQFRRDRNFFDYDLLANPLNPPTSNPFVPVLFSPHQMEITRRMYDTDLRLLPDSKVTIRLGYSRNRSEGPSLSSFHEGTDVLLNQLWNVTSDVFRIGFDVKVLPKTTISYDQYVDLDRNDTDYTLNPFISFPLATGQLATVGLPINSVAGQPCTPVFRNGFLNAGCNGYFAYTRNQAVRTTTPTEALTFQSSYFRRLNLVGRVTYSSGDVSSPYSEFFQGLVTRTKERQFTFSGPVSNRRVAATASLGATVEITKRLQLSDDFHYDNWRLPGLWDSIGTATVGVPVGTPPRVTLLSPLGATTTTPAFTANFMGQKLFSNLIQLEFTASKRFGVRVGYRFRHRRLFKAEPEVVTDPEAGIPEFEGDTLEVNEHSPLFGIWLRPIDALRINAEVEATTADNSFTRISPRHQQNYRVRARYAPVRWANLSASANLWEASNSETDTNFRQHYRNYGFIASLLPKGPAGFDVSYNYTDSLQNALICFNDTFTPPGTIANGCPTFDAADNPNPNQIYSTYVNNTHYFSAAVVLRPVKRVSARLGYGLTSVDGTTTLLNPLQPFGPLRFTYHQPLASVSYEFVKYWSVNAYWNYDQYNEDSFVGPTAPRYFHDNRTVLSLKYAF